MNRFIKLLVFFLVLIVGSANCFAQFPMYNNQNEVDEEMFIFTTLEDGSVEIQSYLGEDVELTIPSKLDNKKVTSLADYSFFCSNTLKTVIIPDSVLSIGDYAFAWCTSLLEITLPAHLTAMGINPFEFCPSLETIHLASSNTSFYLINNVLFRSEDNLLISYPCGEPQIEYYIPEGTRIIGECAFYSAENLEYVSIPDSVISIKASAFCNCNQLSRVTVSLNLTEIGRYAFFDCSSLNRLKIPASVTSIGARAFNNKQLTLRIAHDSYAEGYCSKNGIRSEYFD